jgi:hypothetical protein
MPDGLYCLFSLLCNQTQSNSEKLKTRMLNRRHIVRHCCSTLS